MHDQVVLDVQILDVSKDVVRTEIRFFRSYTACACVHKILLYRYMMALPSIVRVVCAYVYNLRS